MNLRLFLWIYLCLIPLAARAQTPCLPVPLAANETSANTALDMTVLDGQVEYDFSRSEQELPIIASASGVVSSIDRRLLGLTTSAFERDTNITIRAYPREGGWCAYPMAVKLKIGWTPIHVYVSRSYPEGTCQHTAVLDHEHNHVRIYREVFVRFLPDFKQAVLNASAPFFAPDQVSAQTGVENSIDASLKDEYNKFHQAFEIINAELDAPSSIEWTLSQCSFW
jgi:hypothetical protein